ncbi:MAG: Bax inhibitor-1/YccA family protein [Spirochaeta sp.]
MSDRSYTGAQVRVNSILRNVYLWMTLGLAVTGGVAFLTAGSGLGRAIAQTPFLFIVMIIGQFGLVIYLSSRITSMAPQTAIGAFLLYASLNGIIFSFIFSIYAGTTIASTFFVTAGTFAGMSLYAMTTKEDLTRYGKYLIMGLWGIILASVVNIFLGSSGLEWIISYAGVLIFVGLTAYDTQAIARLSNQYSGNVGSADYARLSIMGALKLYLDFINLFLFFLRIFGGSRS